MKIQQIKLSSLTPNPKNMRIHTDKQIHELGRSYEAFGQIRPIVVDENNVILAGHGLWEAMVALEVEKADVLKLDDLTEATKKKLMIADNKIYEMGSTNFDALNELLLELKNDDDLSVPGFDDDLLSDLFANPVDIDMKLSEYGDISDEKAEEMREQLEATKAQIENAENAKNDIPEGENEVALDSDLIQVDTDNPENPRPFVVCPHCGEKIWL